jgi:cell wall-associated NlpC family hydrolase
MISEFTLAYAISFLGKPYIWGGQSPEGVDCSGYAILVGQAEGIFPTGFDATAQGIYTYLKINGAREAKPSQGCFTFYGKDLQTISHVSICLDSFQVIEAGGGNSRTKTREDAAKIGAHVRIRPNDYRKDKVATLTMVKNIVPLKPRK